MIFTKNKFEISFKFDIYLEVKFYIKERNNLSIKKTKKGEIKLRGSQKKEK